MSTSFSLKSNTSDRELEFYSSRPDYFVVELRGRAVEATREVYAYAEAHGFSEFFAKLAAYERPWIGTKDWNSLEGEFSLSAVCSALGHVNFSIRICELLGGREDWEVSAKISSEFGLLPALAAKSKQFFDIVAST